jgi:predicted DsbA family dithiol-disulfide isomerase
VKDYTIQITIYSDVVCPWCFIGKRRLEQALETVRNAQQTDIAWRPFQLNPTMPKEGMDRRDYLDAKFSGTEARRAMQERVAKAGEADGIVFAFDRIERTPNTFDAHRLNWVAQRQGTHDDLAEALFHAYFTEGRDIGDDQTLADIAAETGLGRDAVARFLASDQGIEDVRAEEAAGHRLGIRGVPYFVVNGRYRISGAQPPDRFVSALRNAAADDAGRKAGR